MLPHWFKTLQRDELRIFIHPDYIELTRLRRHWREYFAAKQIAKIRVDINDAHSDPQTIEWDSVLKTLGETLRQPEWQDATVSIVLSDHFVRYTTIPNHQGLFTPAEQQAYVRHCFSQAFGEQASGWNVQACPAGFEKSSLASAIPDDLLQSLMNILHGHQFKLSAVLPQFMLAANDCIASFEKSVAKNTEPSFWLVVVLDDRLCIALIEHGHWRSISNVSAETDIYSQIKAVISRTNIYHGIERQLPVVLNWLASATCLANRLSEFKVIHVADTVGAQQDAVIPTHFVRLESA